MELPSVDPWRIGATALLVIAAFVGLVWALSDGPSPEPNPDEWA
jgi:hypothetical protein